METKEFMDLPEVAQYLGVSLETVYRYIRNKSPALPAIKISSKRLLVNKKELDAWIFSFREGENK